MRKTLLSAVLIGSSAIAFEQASGLLLNGLDVRIGHDSIPALIKTSDCYYETEASSETLGKITLTPTVKVCDSVRTEIEARQITIAANELTSALTGERINTVEAGTTINIATWE